MIKKLFLSLAILVASVSGTAQILDNEWDDFFMPGGGYKIYTPKNDTALGTYSGYVTEFVIYARAKGKESTLGGPARIKSYVNLSIMNSDNSESQDIFLFNSGINLSFESKTDRKFVIPYFGLELGGIFQRDFSSFQITPVAGIQLFSSKSFIVNVQGGYQYSARRFNEYSGFTCSATFNFLLWNK